MGALSQVHQLFRLVRDHGVRTVVETGCFQGRGINQALQAGATQVYSCDINETYVAACRRRFMNKPVSIKHQRSVEFLLTTDFGEEPVLFWIDAHWPGDYTKKHGGTTGSLVPVESDCYPLIEDVRAIVESRRDHRRDVIICDDIHCISDPANPVREMGTWDDKHLVDESWEELVGLIRHSHTWRVHANSEGGMPFAMLIAEPMDETG